MCSHYILKTKLKSFKIKEIWHYNANGNEENPKRIGNGWWTAQENEKTIKGSNKAYWDKPEISILKVHNF